MSQEIISLLYTQRVTSSGGKKTEDIYPLFFYLLFLGSKRGVAFHFLVFPVLARAFCQRYAVLWAILCLAGTFGFSYPAAGSRTNVVWHRKLVSLLLFWVFGSKQSAFYSALIAVEYGLNAAQVKLMSQISDNRGPRFL